MLDAAMRWLPQGTKVKFSCFEYGDWVTGPYGRENIWNRLDDGGYASDAWIWTGFNTPVVPKCPASPPAPMPAPRPVPSPTQRYNREVAKSWAIVHWQDPELIKGGDCTWFVSQALWAGGLPQSRTWARVSPNIWDRRQPTATAKVANKLPAYLVSSGLATMTKINWADNRAGGAQVGDLIVYDWDGPADGKIDHVSIVTGFSGTYPLVTQHTSARLNRGWSWDPGNPQSQRNSGWIQNTHPGSVAYLIHITA